MSVAFQALCTCAICYLSLNMGLILAWPSSTIKMFRSNATTLHRPMKETELALLGSLSSIGAMVGTPIAGYLLDMIGRKYCAILASLAYVISWTLIAFSTQVEVILLAVFISGLGATAMLIVRVYVSEICQESVRGAMTTGSMVFYTMGLLLSYLLGGCLDYTMMTYVCVIVSVVGVGMLGILKESPTFLMKKGLEKEAAKSFAFYRRVTIDSKLVLQEMDTLRRAFCPSLDDKELSPDEEKLQPKQNILEKHSLWQFLKKSEATRRALLLTFVLATVNTFQGLIAIQVYAEPLFVDAIPNISSTLCSVLLAVVTVVAGLAAGYLTDVAGRRPLMIYSSTLTGVWCLLLGTQLHIHWAPYWLTAVFIYLFCIAYTFGAGTVPFVLVTEVFLPEIKSLVSMLVIEWSWLCSFIILFIFNPLVSFLGLGPVFYIFAVICFLSAFYSAIYQPETKGLPVDAIQELFVKRK